MKFSLLYANDRWYELHAVVFWNRYAIRFGGTGTLRDTLIGQLKVKIVPRTLWWEEADVCITHL